MSVLCPKCTSDNVESHGSDSDDMYVWENWHCDNCDFDWIRQYQYMAWKADNFDDERIFKTDERYIEK